MPSDLRSGTDTDGKLKDGIERAWVQVSELSFTNMQTLSKIFPFPFFRGGDKYPLHGAVVKAECDKNVTMAGSAIFSTLPSPTHPPYKYGSTELCEDFILCLKKDCNLWTVYRPRNDDTDYYLWIEHVK